MGHGLSRTGRNAGIFLPICTNMAYLFSVGSLLSLSLAVNAAPQNTSLISANPATTHPVLENLVATNSASGTSEPSRPHTETTPNHQQTETNSGNSGEFSGLMSTPLIRPKPTTQSHAASPLPLGSLLDSQGHALPLPSQTLADFSYSSPVTPELTPAKTPRSKKSPKAKTVNANTSTKRAKTQSNTSKQLLTRRENVANDANCRWLDNRMTQLESQLPKNTDHKNAHQQTELSARWQEWQCLQCDSQVTANIDRSHCQYRR